MAHLVSSLTAIRLQVNDLNDHTEQRGGGEGEGEGDGMNANLARPVRAVWMEEGLDGGEGGTHR